MRLILAPFGCNLSDSRPCISAVAISLSLKFRPLNQKARKVWVVGSIINTIQPWPVELGKLSQSRLSAKAKSRDGAVGI